MTTHEVKDWVEYCIENNLTLEGTEIKSYHASSAVEFSFDEDSDCVIGFFSLKELEDSDDPYEYRTDLSIESLIERYLGNES